VNSSGCSDGTTTTSVTTRSSADANKPARHDVRYVIGTIDSRVALHLLQLPKS